jgi:rod shape determining protein RodA
VIPDRLRPLIGEVFALGRCAWPTVFASVALSLIGIYAIDIATSADSPDGLVTMAGKPLKQLMYLGIGLLAAGMIVVPRYRLFRFIAWPFMAVMLGLLVFLLIPAVPGWIVKPVNGARSWITVGEIKLQPSEFTKIAYVLVMAKFLQYRKNHRHIGGMIPSAVITAVPVGLIVLQPDLGTASLFGPALFAMLVAAGAKLRHLLLIVVVAMMAAPAAYPLLRDHQKLRIQGIIFAMRGSDEGADTFNYQRRTAMRIAGAGGLTGNSDQKSRSLILHNSLPEAHNDMVFAVVLNRFGLLGGLVVLMLYGMWVVGACMTAAASKDAFGRLLIVGCATVITAQVVINVGMTVGLVPIIGITLPFLSFGGSSMLTVWLMTGLILNVAMRPMRPPYREPFEYHDDDHSTGRDPWFSRSKL